MRNEWWNDIFNQAATGSWREGLFVLLMIISVSALASLIITILKGMV